MTEAAERSRPAALAVRGALGGTLMGLANLVPGISGGTMLLAAGVYPAFIDAIAEVTTLRIRLRAVVLLGAVAGAAALAILLLAGVVKAFVEEHRWAAYSLFIGLTLGGAPLVWRMARPATPALWAGALAAFAVMVAMAAGSVTGGGGDGRDYGFVFLSGLAASSAMILPGVSGGYLLLLLGQYERILGAVDSVKRGLLGDALDLGLVLESLHVVIPLGVGVLAGVVGVSNLLHWLLRRFEKATLGALLGLLLGAVVGLWPFQQAEAPTPGDVVKGRVVTAENAHRFEREDWPLRRFDPSGAQAAGALALTGLGLALTLGIGRLGDERPPAEREEWD